jgi:hypothetical protein
VNKSSNKINDGQCKFPFRTKRLIKRNDGSNKSKYFTKNECIKREGELMCPVELHTSGSNVGQGKVWGFCPNSSNITTNTKKIKTQPNFKSNMSVLKQPKSISKCKPINEGELTELIKRSSPSSGKKGEWVGPLKDTYIPDSLFSKSYSNSEEDAKQLCLKEGNCIGITKKKKWSLRKGMKLCRSKDEISYVKRDNYKTLRPDPQTSKKKKIVVLSSNN